MTWAKIDDGWADDPKVLRLPRGVRLMWLEGLLYCARLLTDGAIPAVVLTRITDEPDALDAAQQLVDAGLWEATADGWQVVDYLEFQSSREDVEQRRAENRAKQERSRAHQRGDHSKCTRSRFCPDGALEPVTRDRPSHSRGQSPGQSRPLEVDVDPTRPKEGKVEVAAASAPARSGSPGLPLPQIGVGKTVVE